MNYLVFDVETNGLPLNSRGSAFDVNNWPRITQLAFILCDGASRELTTFSELIKPDGWVIPKEQFFIDNNMSTERCESDGVEIFSALRAFQNALKKTDLKIAHNIRFDNNVIEAEMIRCSITTELFKYKKSYCTMLKTTSLCKLPNKYGNGYKWPKLSELHNFLFNEDFADAHDALGDIRATIKCFFELKRLNKLNY